VTQESTQAVVPSWSYTGNLNTARFDDTATLLPSGKVLVAGGNYGSAIGALTAELYDPAAGIWSICPVSYPLNKVVERLSSERATLTQEEIWRMGCSAV
jgi:hypothetical protein